VLALAHATDDHPSLDKATPGEVPRGLVDAESVDLFAESGCLCERGEQLVAGFGRDARAADRRVLHARSTTRRAQRVNTLGQKRVKIGQGWHTLHCRLTVWG